MSARPTIDDPDAPRGKRVGDLDRAQRAADAVALRSQGRSYRQIGQALGCHASTAHDLVTAGLAAVPAESVHALRRVESERLDAIDAELDKIIADPPHIVSASGQITAQADLRVAVQALETKTRVSARRARLLGLDSPQITVREARLSDDLNRRIDATIRALREQWAVRQIPPALPAGDDDAELPA